MILSQFYKLGKDENGYYIETGKGYEVLYNHFDENFNKIEMTFFLEHKWYGWRATEKTTGLKVCTCKTMNEASNFISEHLEDIYKRFRAEQVKENREILVALLQKQGVQNYV